MRALLLLGLALTLMQAWAEPWSEYELRVSDRVTLAGELDPRRLGAAAGADLLIIDLRVPEETEAEKRAALGSGIPWINLPVDGKPPALEDVRWLAQVLDAFPDRQVVMHCRTGHRAALLWSAVQLEAGRSLAEVEAEVAPLITYEPIWESIRRFADTTGEAPSDGNSEQGESGGP